MKRLTCLPAILVALMALQGCAAVDLLSFARGQKALTIDPNDVVFLGVDAQGFHFEVGLNFQNQNEGQASITRVSLNASLEDREVFSMESTEPVHIGPKATVIVRMPAVIKAADVMVAAAAGKRTLVFAGTVTADLGILGQKEFTFQSEHKLFPSARARVEFEGLSLAESSLRKLVLTLTLRIREGKAERLRNVSLSGTVYVNGHRAGSVDVHRAEEADDLVELRLSLSTLSAALVTARIIKEKSCDLRAELLFEGETDTLTFRVPYVLEKKGLGLGNPSE